jgi:hypothetical protein
VDKAVEEIKLGAEKLKKTWGFFTETLKKKIT